MNMELYQLQKEVRELRQQNYEKQKNIHYIPFNIISNNLYINNSLNKSSINSYIPKDNNIYTIFPELDYKFIKILNIYLNK